MQWSDVVKKRERKELRQFAGLCTVVGAALVGWRLWSAIDEWSAYVVGGTFLGVGLLGMAAPRAISWVYTAWMAAVFPIGWTVSRLIVGLMFFGLFTPVAWFFRWTGRDALRLRRQQLDSLWIPKRQSDRAETYLRQY